MKQTSDTAGAAALAPVQLIKVADIVPDPNNRKEHDKDRLQLLANEIAVDGLLQPIVVRPTEGGKFMLIAGERRWHAFQLLKRSEIPATVRIGEEQKTATRKRVAENFHREDLTPIEKARDIKQLEADGMSQQEIAEFLGAKDQSTISNFTRLLGLPKSVQNRVQDGSLNAAQAKALLKFAPWPAVCEFIASAAVKHEISSKDLESGDGDGLYDVGYELDRKGLAKRVYTHGWAPKYTQQIAKDPDFIDWGYSTFCLKPKKLKAIDAEIEAAKKAERSAASKRSAAARKNTSNASKAEVDKGVVIDKDFEVFAALVPETKLAKRGKNLVCLDSSLWQKIRGAAISVNEADEAKLLEKLRCEAVELVKKAKTVDGKLLTVLFADGPCELEQTSGGEIHSAAKLIGAKMLSHLAKSVPKGWTSDGWDFAKIATFDPAETLKVLIVARLEQMGKGYMSAVECELALLKVVLGRDALGRLKETPEGRSQMLAQVAKKTGFKLPGAAVSVAKPAPAAGIAKSAKKSNRAVITDETRVQVKRGVEAGLTGAEIAKKVGISLPSVQNIKKALGLIRR